MDKKILDYEWLEDGRFALYFHPPEVLPAETRQHLLSAQKEMLMALRSLVDRAIQRTEEADDDGEGRRHRVEVT